MNYLNQMEQLNQFRQSVYNVFTNGADVLMNLIDALSSNTSAQSVVELSLNPVFERGYSALFKGIANFHQSPNQRQKKERQKDESKPATEKEAEKELQPEMSATPQKTVGRRQAVPTLQKAAERPQTIPTPQKAAERPQTAPTPQKAAEQSQASPKQVERSEQTAAKLGTKTKPEETSQNAGACRTTRADVERQSQQPQKQSSGESQPDYAQAPIQQAPAQQSQKQAPNQADCDWANDARVEVQSASIKPEIAAKQPEIAAKQPELAVKNSPLASSDIISSEELTALMLEDRQARALLEHQLLSIIVPYLPPPEKRPFYLFGLDVTSQPRQFSPTLSSRGFVYHPNAIKGNKPVTIGHQYSLLAYLPEKKEAITPPWIVPLSTRRVATDQDKELVGMEQIKLLMDDKDLPFHNQLCTLVGDTSYSKRSHQCRLR